MAKKLHFYSFLLLVFFSIDYFAQNYTISGKVYDSESKEPLPFVPVLIKGTTIGGTTDFDGNFSITTSKLGDSIIATYVGYKKLVRPIKRGVTQLVNMPMVLEGVNLLEVV
ncbi:MAG: carboxypeptidase-like regulatory domain-containing protein, partial [Bacteroidia bacterium]|nr:carboxypeptidase-like regulatory domain-containing protein [Bacteroidia bacterium]